MDDPGVALARSYQMTNMCCGNCALRIYSEVDAARARDRTGIGASSSSDVNWSSRVGLPQASSPAAFASAAVLSVT